VFEGVHPVLVADVHPGSGRHQDPRDLLVRPRSVAEDDAFQQRGPAQIVDVVDVDAEPVTVDGQVVAGIGVGGAPSGDLDEQYAAAGAASLR
jgi:hypothetical protein